MRTRIFQLFKVAAGCALCLLTGCGQALTDNDRLDDEAMKRARIQKILPEVAAKEWFYPKQIHDYFEDMDQVAMLPDDFAYQLLKPQTKEPAVAEAKRVTNLSQVLGRNTWMMWTGGNEAFWDTLGRQYGFLDFLRLLDSRNHSRRFADAGLINEPGMRPATEADEFGLWLDEPVEEDIRQWRHNYIRRAFNLDGSSPAPVKGGAAYGGPMMAGYEGQYPKPEGAGYDKRIPPPEIYGLSSGVVGLRLFPNPNFDAAARSQWEKRKDGYYEAKGGDAVPVRPYRVGMSCAFCHASFHPLNPPADVANPAWRNISGNIGAQYLRVRASFGNLLQKDNFIYHILDSQPPGTVDTSLIASDNINNPNAMNSVFNLAQRVLISLRNPQEQLSIHSAQMPSVWGGLPGNAYGWTVPTGDPDKPQQKPDVPDEALVKLASKYWNAMFLPYAAPPQPALGPYAATSLSDALDASNNKTRGVPRILFDGSDSIGAWGALARVYLNIGTNSEQWDTLHNPVVGFQHQRPFTIRNLEEHSVYWYATQLRVGPLRDYFLAVSAPMPALAAESGATAVDSRPASASPALRAVTIDKSKLALGRKVFAQNCIVCHSSIQPPRRFAEMARDTQSGTELWDHNPGRWLSQPDYIAWAEAAVESPDFWQANYLSTDYRIRINDVETNACRAMATNALTGNVWEDFASETYRKMPSVGAINYFNPYLGEHGGDSVFTPRHNVADGVPKGGGGPGFYRVPSLISIWATAPLLHNNSVGTFNNDPSVRGRLVAFDDAMHKLLWKERRQESSSYNGATPERLKADHGLIWRTTEETYIKISSQYLPELIAARFEPFRRFMQGLSDLYPALRDLSGWQRPLPTILLFGVGLVLLVYARGIWVRVAGYGFIASGLAAGALIYFLTGGFGDIRIGPIPKGTPVGLLANLNPDADPSTLVKTLAVAREAFGEIKSSAADSERANTIMRQKIAPALMEISKCPDFVMDHGHYFPWFDRMTDEDKEAVIELLKTF